MLRRGGLAVKAGAHGTAPGDFRQALERAQAAVPPGRDAVTIWSQKIFLNTTTGTGRTSSTMKVTILRRKRSTRSSSIATTLCSRQWERPPKPRSISPGRPKGRVIKSVYQAQTPPVQSVGATDRRNEIVSDADLREAARQPAGTITGTVANSEIDREQ